MTPREVTDVMSLATLAISFATQPETWPVFVAWVNRPELGPDDEFILTRQEAQSIGGRAACMMEVAMELVGDASA